MYDFHKENRKAPRHDKVAWRIIVMYQVNFQSSQEELRTKKEEDIDDILHVPSSDSFGTYLGCNNIDHRRNRSDFIKNEK